MCSSDLELLYLQRCGRGPRRTSDRLFGVTGRQKPEPPGQFAPAAPVFMRPDRSAAGCGGRRTRSAFRRRGRLTHRGDGDAQLDELRRGERNLRDGMAIPLLRNQPLVEADAQPGGHHVVGGEAVSCGEAGLRVQPQRGQQAILIGDVVGRGVEERLPPERLRAEAAADGFSGGSRRRIP